VAIHLRIQEHWHLIRENFNLKYKPLLSERIQNVSRFHTALQQNATILDNCGGVGSLTRKNAAKYKQLAKLSFSHQLIRIPDGEIHAKSRQEKKPPKLS